MNEPGDRMIEDDEPIETLIDAVIDGSCDEEGLRRLGEQVRDDPTAREAYLAQMRLHALLEWSHGRVGCEGQGVEGAARVVPSRTARPAWWRFGLAAALLVAAGLIALAARSGLGRSRGVATLVESQGVVWAEGQEPIALNARLGPQEMHCRSGTLRLAFDTGALVALEGPADVAILSGTRLRASRGRIIARLSAKSRGFAIETPTTLVIDQGTEFGVEVDGGGQTGVVVFEGAVDLSRPSEDAGGVPIKRLGQGEALRVGRSGELSRIVAIDRRHGDDEWLSEPSPDRNAVFRSVRDNIRGLESSKYYQIVRNGLHEDAPAYVDRPHQWNGLDSSGLPPFLVGADYIMPFNDDKWRKDLQISVEFARAATLYVFCDNREKPPSWLAGQFTDTGFDIGLDEGSWPDPSKFSVGVGPGRSINQVFSVWRREVKREETVDLGALAEAVNNRAMYGIAAVARPRAPAPGTSELAP